MILDGGKKSDSLFRMCNEGALYDVPIIMGTHYDARIPMGPFVTTDAGGVEYDALQRLFSQVFPLSSELVPSGQIVPYQIVPLRSA